MRHDPTSAPRELFIYYRVELAHVVSARAAVAAFQAELTARNPQLVARLLCRPDTSNGLQTWMETYSITPMKDNPGISDGLQAEIEFAASVLLPHIAGPRHVEVFVSCAS